MVAARVDAVPGANPDKVAIPPALRVEVERSALLAELDRAWSVRLTVVVGPAGYGKSTAVAAWARRQAPGTVAWLRLDASDVDPVRFARHLDAALQALTPAVSAHHLRSVDPGRAELGEDAILDLATAFADRGPTAIVVDDLHAVSGSGVADDIVRLVDAAPSNLHVVLVSRTEPRLALHRARLVEGVVEIRQPQLTFEIDDAAAFIAGLGASWLTEDQVASVVRRTEGWAAGLQLAGVALRRSGPTAHGIDDLVSDDRHVVEYLTEEVLDGLDADLRTFVLQTAVLDRVDGPLADAVTGTTGGARRLDDIARASLFIAAVDAARTTFRYHRLFAQLLRARLRVEQPGEEERILRCAAEVLLGRGDVMGAGDCALRAGDWTSLLAVIAAHGRSLYERGETRTLITWIRAVPPDLQRDPHVALLHAELLVTTGASGAVQALVDALDIEALSASERVLVDVLRSVMVLWGADAAAAIEAAEAALDGVDRHRGDPWPDLLGVTSPEEVELLMWFTIGLANLALDRPGAAVTAARRAAARGGYPPWRINGIGGHALALAIAGDADVAAAEVERGLGVARDTGFEGHVSVALCHVAAAVVARDAGRIDDAGRELAAAGPLLRRNGRRLITALAAAVGGDIALAAGQPEQALADVAGHRAAARQMGEGLASRLAAVEARALLDLGREREAALVLAGVGPSAACAGARARLAAETADVEALRTLVGSWPSDRTIRDAFERDVWSAVLADLDGTAAVARFDDIAGRALANGHHQWIVDGGRAVRAALRRAAERRPTPQLRQVLALVERATPTRRSRAAELVDPLTEREIEVIAYLPTRLSNVEMAANLYISANTLKTHLSRIYRKLGVTTRTEAIERCVELGLL
ncbi:MAG TPA: LuxR C-terminal-related transcriptional regulator [Acidimicrobiales bacterium]|nr:LuxR C-terminal-related transcriptional regulator [Acidimicrobiales bacterium]